MIDRESKLPFIGSEVENTKFKGYRILFVPTLNFDITQYVDRMSQHNITHIYLGANSVTHLFQRYLYAVPEKEKVEFYRKWYNLMLRSYASFPHLCFTLELPIQAYGYVDIIDNDNLCFLLSLPDVNAKNVSIKIDNKFNTGKGVFVFDLAKQKNDENFTAWDAYKGDQYP